MSLTALSPARRLFELAAALDLHVPAGMDNSGGMSVRSQLTDVERFVRAVAAKDIDVLQAVLAPNLRFRGMTPGREWAAATREGTLEILFGSWFEDGDEIEEIVSHDVHQIVDRVTIRYRFRVRNADGAFLVEQQGVAICDDGQISDLALVCSGYRPIEGSA